MGNALISRFGTASTGDEVERIILTSDALKVSILTWGAAIQDVRLAGVDRPLTLGSDRLADYEGQMRHHGTIIGPVVNRISTGRVTIDGMTYELERNFRGRIHLHSGKLAIHRRNWKILSATETEAVLALELEDGECGLPGRRRITARYTVDGPCLALQIEGETDAPTLMSIANHSYWNLDGSQDYGGHRLWIDADRYLPSTEDFYPTGEIAEVADTVMDFRRTREIAPGAPQFDNCFCLSDAPSGLRPVLRLTGARGVEMTVATNQPGIHVYDGREAIRPGRGPFEGLAIEAEFWPDAPTNPHFPSIRLDPEHRYRQETTWTFWDGQTERA